MIDPAFLDDLRARVPVSEVVGRRVRLRKVGREWKGLSPFNKERSPSFFVNDQKRFWHDFSSGKSGDIFTFMMEAEGVTFPQAVEQLAATAGMTVSAVERNPEHQRRQRDRDRTARAEAAERERQDDLARQRRALAIWDGAGDLADTLGLRYLTAPKVAGGRALAVPEGVSGRVLRFHPRCPWERKYVPALIALYRDIRTDEPKAIWRCALTPDGCKIDRKVLGPKAGCAVKLTANEDVEQGLHIGEGVETTLAAVMIGFRPAWALGDKDGIAKFPVFAGIDALTIIVDRDANGAGQDAASTCFDRWTAAGREVWTIVPDAVGADLNDVVAGTA